MQYYVIDTTVSPTQDKRFGTYPEVVRYLESMSVRAYKQTRNQRMVLLEELGHGHDDTNSVNFVRSMAEKFSMGVIREGIKDGGKMRCDITSIALFQKEEYGS